MKRTSCSPAMIPVAGSDTHSDKKQRTMQEHGPADTATPATAKKTTTEATSSAAASDEPTGEATLPAPDDAGYVSDAFQADSDDDSSISDSLQWPPDEDKESLPNRDQRSYLCSRCREIDFDEIFSRNSVMKGGDLILSFSDEQRVLRDPECAFCQAMQFIYPSLDMWDQSWKQSHPLVAATVDNLVGFKYEDPVYAKGKIILTFAHHFESLQWYKRIYRWTRHEAEQSDKSPDFDLVGYLAEEQTMDYDCKALPAASVKPHVDFEWVKRKLNRCRASDLTCMNKRRGEVLGMRLIDCKTRTVVPAPQRGCTYAALSYVWGTSKSTSENGPALNNGDEKLPADLPNTIADAMLVALKLRIRYLWCDRYCILQDPQNREEEEEKHGQIVRMCEIYSGASITIIAAAGDGPDYGLPGVSKKRQPPRVHIGSRTVFATLADPKTLIDRSKWSTRGWTFQEGLLARRRLVFTDQQVYFQCGQTGAFEAYDKSGEMSISIASHHTQNTPVYPYFSMNPNRLPYIWRKIDDYAELTLGNTQDILNGFLGILRNYEEVASPDRNFRARNVAGLPMNTGEYDPRSWPSALIVALGWQCDIPGRRRNGFPSWSWVGWYCKGFARNERTVYLPESTTSSAFVSIEGPNSELLEHSKLHALIEARYDLSKAKILRITAPSLEARIVPYHASIFTGSIRDTEVDNTKRKLVVQYNGFEYGAFINLSDVLVFNASVLLKELRCFAIVLDKDRSDVAHEQLGLRSSQLGHFVIFYATTLIVVETNGGFERIGVSYVTRNELRQVGSTKREFKLM